MLSTVFLRTESIQDLLKLSRVIPEMIKAQGLLDKEQRAMLERSAEMDLQLKQAQALQKEMLGEITDLCSLWDIPMSPRVILKGRNPSTSSLGGLTKEYVSVHAKLSCLSVSMLPCRCWFSRGVYFANLNLDCNLQFYFHGWTRSYHILVKWTKYLTKY